MVALYSYLKGIILVTFCLCRIRGRVFCVPSSVKATSHLTIFVRVIRAKGKFQRNNYHQYGQRHPSFAGKKLSVSLIAHLQARKIAERELVLNGTVVPESHLSLLCSNLADFGFCKDSCSEEFLNNKLNFEHIFQS